MSLKTWTKYYYRVEAEKVPRRDMLAHSIRKWTGLAPETLKKHGLGTNAWGDIVERDGVEGMSIDSESCALCHRFYKPHSEGGACARCPLAKSLGFPCDEEGIGPYAVWRKTGDNRPMLNALKRVRSPQSRTGS